MEKSMNVLANKVKGENTSLKKYINKVLRLQWKESNHK